MTPYLQRAVTDEPHAPAHSAGYTGLDTSAPSLKGIVTANDNQTSRPNILVKRRNRRARLAIR